MINTAIEYQGKVDFCLNIGNKSIKINANIAGTLILHQSICRFLAGQYRGLCDIPNFIDIRNATTNKSILTQIIPLTGRVFKLEGTEYIVQCEAQIAYSQLSTQISLEDSYQIFLCADRDPDVYMGSYRDLAYVDIEASNLASIIPGTSAAVQWKLHIKNGG